MSATIDPIWPEDFEEADYAALPGERALEVTGDSEAEHAPWAVQDWTHAGPKAEAFFFSNAKVIALRGPVGSGKTTANLRSRFRRATTMPRSTIDGVRRYKVVIARATYRQLWQTTIPSWWEVVPKKIGTWSGGRGDPVTHRLEWEDAYGKVEFIAEFLAFGESAAEVLANMRGIQTTDLLMEEADTCPVEVFTTGSGRINRYPAPVHFEGYDDGEDDYGQISMSYNATDVDNWVVKTIEGEGLDQDAAAREVRRQLEKAGIAIEFYRQPGYGEPGLENTANLPASYYPSQIALMTAAGQTDAIERLVRNQHSYIAAGDLVFKRDFNPAIHVAPAPLEPWPDVPLRLGLDQGLWGAAVIGQFMGPYRWQILDEFWFPHRIFADEFGERLNAFLMEKFGGMPIEAAYGDMAGEQESGAAGENAVWNAIVSDKIGVYIQPQTTGANRITPRLAAVRAGLAAPLTNGHPGLLVSPVCKALIRAFRARYVWRDEVGPTGEKTKKPNKSFHEADVMDALQYLMLSESIAEGITPVGEMIRDHAGLPASRGDRGQPPAIETAYDPLEALG